MQRFFKWRFLMLAVVASAASCSPATKEAGAPGDKPAVPALPPLPTGTSTFKLPPPPGKPGTGATSQTGAAATAKQEPKTAPQQPAGKPPAPSVKPDAKPATTPPPTTAAKPAGSPKTGPVAKPALGGQSPLVGTWATAGPGSPRRLEIKENGSGAVLLGDIPWIRFTWVKDGNDLVATHVDNDVKFRIAARGEGRLSWRAADGGSAKEVEYERER
jgi:hypothetical protein